MKSGLGKQPPVSVYVQVAEMDGVVVKRIITLFLAPMFAIAVAAACVEAWILYGNQIEPGLLELAMVASAAFSVALVLANHITQWVTSSKISKLHEGVRGYERDIRKRIETVSGTAAKLSDLEELAARLDALEINAKLASDQRCEPNARILLDTSAESGEFSDSIRHASAGGPNVIPLDPAKRAATQLTDDNSVSRLPRNFSGLIDNGQLKMYLQPLVTLPERTVPGYEAFARLELDEDTIIPASEFLPKAVSTKVIGAIDREILEQAIVLLRSLRRKKQNAEVFWNISPATLQSKSAFALIKETLAANTALGPFLVAEISQNDFAEFGKKQQSRLSAIRELGFKLSLDQCTSLESAEWIAASGMFSYIKVPVSTLEQYAETETENIGGQLTSLFHETDIRLIATHVEHENQVMQLIDNDIGLAQGNLFSVPRPPKAEPGATGIPDAGKLG